MINVDTEITKFFTELEPKTTDKYKYWTDIGDDIYDGNRELFYFHATVLLPNKNLACFTMMFDLRDDVCSIGPYIKYTNGGPNMDQYDGKRMFSYKPCRRTHVRYKPQTHDFLWCLNGHAINDFTNYFQRIDGFDGHTPAYSLKGCPSKIRCDDCAKIKYNDDGKQQMIAWIRTVIANLDAIDTQAIN